MNLSKINLNLLKALDALLEEQHVTRAGEKLFLSQSAMSNLLKQLREVFDDELFVRGAASSMTPTAKALALEEPVRKILQQTALLFDNNEKFDPTQAKCTFTIGMSDYTELVLLPFIICFLNKHAPNIKINVKHLNYIQDPECFENNKLDLAIGIYNKIPPHLQTENLFTETAVLVGCKKNPLLNKPLTQKQFALAEQIVILFFEDIMESVSEQLILKMGHQRRAIVTLPHILPALHLLPNTHLIASILTRVVEIGGKHLPLKCQPVPFKYPEIVIKQIWHPKNTNHPAHRWLRESIVKLAGKI